MPKRQKTIEEQRQESTYQAEHNPKYIFHDAVLVVVVFAVYGVFLAMGKMTRKDESDS